MRETKIIRLRTAFYRLAEGLLLLTGAASLLRLAMEQQSASTLQKSFTELTAKMWEIGTLITLGTLAFFAGFIATIQSLQWLFAIIFRGPFVLSEGDKRRGK